MKYNKTRRAVIKLQAFIRGYLVRKKVGIIQIKTLLGIWNISRAVLPLILTGKERKTWFLSVEIKILLAALSIWQVRIAQTQFEPYLNSLL